MPTTYKWLAGSTASGTTLTLSSIPQTYTDLVIHANLQGTVSASGTIFLVKVNGFSTSYYSLGAEIGDQSNLGTIKLSNEASFRTYTMPGSSQAQGPQGTAWLYFPNYTVQKKPTIYTMAGHGTTSTTLWGFGFQYGMYNDASINGINSITISPVNNAFNGKIDLYGILKN